ncbi:tRNA dihydrouridine synthase [Anaeromicropila populeti]|uniref:tRNA-dihydrouridine synthase n=1 Tax=Anaeromicropila populeti TaxID=37658 RepID=A0A1I6ISR5_9FIRM|nr:tRNA-dihydrouridine synthase family protein [Anaeromicropila populeti]SFR69784.1 tRNA-U20a,U20b-dihydrouridine synthase [Anaeromicropila populeti]
MKFYLAPMEGVTGYIFRNAYHTFFNHIDKYFAPFIVANQRDSFKTRDLNDILPEHNEGIKLVPQLLTNQAKDFIQTSKRIKELGYLELNLNLGCPSKTVVSKNRGSGFLAQPEELDHFLEEVFSQAITKISIKTRIGRDHPEEFRKLIEIFNKYPLEELIIHPRVQKDFYKNKPNWNVFQEALVVSKNPVCYNGDIFQVNNFNELTAAFPLVEHVMMGRGLIANPGIIKEITEGKLVEKELLKEFHDKIYSDYRQVLFGDKNVLFKMKELWFYMIQVFSDNEKYHKKIRKSERLGDYEETVTRLFVEQDIQRERKISF